ncbi:MAG: aminoacyl-tRNA hydrolase [Fusobacteriaceae bacterium]|jgi:PTH1 family peptidyl-tRNA hydrolase|nr:aminoacyl-tRNA hydrolase [Fusobacteriaceae bacterium]
MKLVIGLGNPSEKYIKTRHNIGFEVIEKLLINFNINDEKHKFKGLISEKNINGEKVLFLKPQAFMNLSGDSVIEVVNFYKLNPNTDLIIIHDDMDLPIGKIRIRKTGSSGGHNGLKSIISHIGQDFIRIKCGIGRTENDTINFVLGNFPKEEREIVDAMIKEAGNAVIDFIAGIDVDRLMQKYNHI